MPKRSRTELSRYLAVARDAITNGDLLDYIHSMPCPSVNYENARIALLKNGAAVTLAKMYEREFGRRGTESDPEHLNQS